MVEGDTKIIALSIVATFQPKSLLFKESTSNLDNLNLNGGLILALDQFFDYAITLAASKIQLASKVAKSDLKYQLALFILNP